MGIIEDHQERDLGGRGDDVKFKEELDRLKKLPEYEEVVGDKDDKEEDVADEGKKGKGEEARGK